jgi:hypothetical protein
MRKGAVTRTGSQERKREAESAAEGGARLSRGIGLSQSAAGRARLEAVMRAAERSGLLKEKSSRIGGMVSPALVAQAKRRTGIERDTDLIEFALASVALEDNFAAAFSASRGKVDEDLKLGF